MHDHAKPTVPVSKFERFQNSVTVETGFSDFVTFDVKKNIIQMTSENNDLEFDRFKAALDEAIQRHAPIKKRYVRANKQLFLNKTMKKS